MVSNVLVLNAGSSSVKYRLIDVLGERTLREGKVERIGEGRTHQEALQELLASVAGQAIDAVGHRVVHGGAELIAPTLVDDALVVKLEQLSPLAPLHNPHNVAGLRAARAALPQVPHVAVFDTAFFSTLPRRARTYAIDQELAQRYGVVRYGFHGTSHAYVAELAARALGRPLTELRLVTLHLGNGASACAVEHGSATETSMGMTPLEGLVMGTRAGDVDPGALLALLRSGLSVDELEQLLMQGSGLKGLSGVSNDLRDIQARAAAGEDRARLAISVFAHRVRTYIGAYAATMGGLDAVVLTGGIGEGSAQMRRRILQRFDYLGLTLDDDRNDAVALTDAVPSALLSTRASRVAALAVKTNEELAIALKTARVVRGEQRTNTASSIPIAVSARHVHLNEEALRALFGPEHRLTHLKDISQPGQFACEEQVSVIGPRGRLDRVRILGPLRQQTQVEISRTDEFALGVDAPLRDSGKLEGSAPITLEGPAGSLHLREGLICAKRHIHMHPSDAEHFGVKDGDEVEVKLQGGPRDLTFGDVLIRVSPSYRLEMHIDTDEANAAELGQGAEGTLVYTPSSAEGVVTSRRLRPSAGG